MSVNSSHSSPISLVTLISTTVILPNVFFFRNVTSAISECLKCMNKDMPTLNNKQNKLTQIVMFSF
jgi:hypothetical protein